MDFLAIAFLTTSYLRNKNKATHISRKDFVYIIHVKLNIMQYRFFYGTKLCANRNKLLILKAICCPVACHRQMLPVNCSPD